MLRWPEEAVALIIDWYCTKARGTCLSLNNVVFNVALVIWLRCLCCGVFGVCVVWLPQAAVRVAGLCSVHQQKGHFRDLTLHICPSQLATMQYAIHRQSTMKWYSRDTSISLSVASASILCLPFVSVCTVCPSWNPVALPSCLPVLHQPSPF